jgi:MerR family transcriptional regulator, heat shock protein HspR
MQDWFEDDEFEVDIPKDECLYPLNIVCRLLDMHTWTVNELVKLEILRPKLIGKKKKLFSQCDMKRIRYVKFLIEERGVNIAGIKVIFEIREE